MPIQTSKTEDNSGRLALLLCLRGGHTFDSYEQSVMLQLILQSRAPEWACFTTYPTIASDSQISRSMALKVIASLQEKGYLLCETRSNKGNKYTINASQILPESPSPMESSSSGIPSDEADECVTEIEDWLKEETSHPNFKDEKYNRGFLRKVLRDCLAQAGSVDYCQQIFANLPDDYPKVFKNMAGSQNLAAYIRKSFPGWVIKYPYIPLHDPDLSPEDDIEETPEEDSND